jgi:amino acid adenylation domain-containing protein
VETAEIEMALLDHPNIKQAAVVARAERDGDARLVAYLVAQNSPGPNSSELRSFVQERFADYMIPSAFVLLDGLPLTPNGKVDRHNLPDPGRSRPELDTPYQPPTTAVEEKLVKIWAEVLSLDRVGIQDNFFALGGHSLLATQVISRIRDLFQVELPLRRLFETPTIAALVDSIEKLHRMTERHGRPAIRAVSRKNPLPLSFAQQRLWFLNRLDPESAAYNQPTVLRLSGPLNVEALQKTLDAIVARHEVLRTTFTAIDGNPVQVVNEPRPVTLPLIDLSECHASQREAELQERLRQLTRKNFDLAKDPMIRGALLRRGENDHVLLLVTHHIASDNWSDQVLFREIASFYEAFASQRSPAFGDLPIQYADFACWQRQWLQGEVLDEELSYWRKQLEYAPVLELPTDRSRPPMRTHQGAQRSIKLSAPLCQKLKELSTKQDTTLFMILLAAFQTLLYRYTGQDDILVGSPIANRGRTEVEGLLGFFINTLVLRTDFSGNPTFEQLLARVREVCLQAYAHQQLPFEKIVEELQPDRDLRRNPLFEVMFELRKARNQTATPGGVKVEELEFDAGLAKFDLTLYMIDEGETLCGLLEYGTDLFDTATIERMLGHFQTLLEGIVSNSKQRISEFPLLTESEKHQLLAQWNDTQREYPKDQCIHELFETQVEKTPDAIALVFEERQLTYRQLNVRANRFAHYLQKLGIGPEVPVGICIERSIEMVVGLLAVLKAGGAYVPVDPNYPKERQSFMLRDADARVVLTQKKFLAAINHPDVVPLDRDWQEIAHESDENPTSGATPENLAYVIYTSGSTGTPKGVLGHHRGVVNRLHWKWRAYPFDANEVGCLKTSLSFVDSVCEVFGPLLQGIPSVVISDEVLMDPRRLIHTLADSHVTRIVLVPSLLRMLLDACPDLQRELPELRICITSGEILPADLVRAFQKTMPRSKLINLYGSTEVAADATCYEVNNNGPLSPVPIGLPIDNTQVYILDRFLNPVPIGVAGELHVGGAGLARGYLDDLELTNEKFIPNPFSTEPGVHLYRTGDLARRMADGKIEFLGRLDAQVKLRGFRIELGEIEAVLNQHPGVCQNAIALRAYEDPQPGKCLVAYVVPRREQAADSAELRRFLKTKLPDYMVPSGFEFLDALPLTTNGKLDRKALPAPDHTQLENNRIFIAPRTADEAAVAEIWSSVLGIEKVGIQDNFFDLGGHSLLAIQIMLRLSDRFRTLLPLRMLFEKPNVEELALEITKTLTEKVGPTKLRGILSELESMSDDHAKKVLGAPSAVEK